MSDYELSQWNREREDALNSLKYNHSSATELKQTVPGLLQSVSSNLDLADQEYARSAFSPFWSAIETATMRLGELASNLQRFVQLTETHKELEKTLIEKYQSRGDAFPVRLQDIYAAEQGQVLSQRMDVLVGRAQTNFQFSTIYEQRRTNSILIAGFTNLGQAIGGMTARITEELEGVVKSIDTASAASSAQSAEAISMLDNIQRRQLPSGATPNHTDY